MKATKIASGFAVTALAAAVSMSATAGVEVNGDEAVDGSASWSGHVEFGSEFILNNRDTYISGDPVDVNRHVDSKKDHKLEASFSVEEGPFSGSLKVGNKEDDLVSISGIEYDDGAFLFSNSVGSIIATEGGIEGLSGGLSYPVDGAFRFYDNSKALGLVGLKFKIQLEDPGTVERHTELTQEAADAAATPITHSMGDGDGSVVAVGEEYLSAQKNGLAGVAAAFDFKKPGTNTQIMANVQMVDTGEGDGETNIFALPFYGLKLIDNTIPKTTLTASVNSGNKDSVYAADADDLADNYEATMTYGVHAHLNLTKPDNGGLTAYASFAEANASADVADQTVTVGAGYQIADVSDKTKKTTLNVDYVMQLIDIADSDQDGAKDTLTASLRQDFNYIYLTAHYKFINEEADDEIHAEAGTQSISGFSAKAGYGMKLAEVDGKDNDNMMFVDVTYSLDDLGNGVDLGARFEQKWDENKLVKADAEAAKASEIIVYADYELDGGAAIRLEYENDNDGTDNRAVSHPDHDHYDGDNNSAAFRDSVTFSASYSF